uniref:Uncharacterized protein n=1 Tax=uncultured Armatimonadetes bacterium TaxID=157466 RepID=A0A6J4K9B2_9BACT|nr:hypothetical protein AVDCRST_MAG63-5076 [uncultured Armatimonadetes bacterium]
MRERLPAPPRFGLGFRDRAEVAQDGRPGVFLYARAVYGFGPIRRTNHGTSDKTPTPAALWSAACLKY